MVCKRLGVAMNHHSNPEKYILAWLAYVALVFVGCLVFSQTRDAYAFAYQMEASQQSDSWTGDPRLPKVEDRFRPLRSY